MFPIARSHPFLKKPKIFAIINMLDTKPTRNGGYITVLLALHNENYENNIRITPKPFKYGSQSTKDIPKLLKNKLNVDI